MIRRLTGFAGIVAAAFILSLQEAPMWTLIALALLAWGVLIVFCLTSRELRR